MFSIDLFFFIYFSRLFDIVRFLLNNKSLFCILNWRLLAREIRFLQVNYRFVCISSRHGWSKFTKHSASCCTLFNWLLIESYCKQQAIIGNHDYWVATEAYFERKYLKFFNWKKTYHLQYKNWFDADGRNKFGQMILKLLLHLKKSLRLFIDNSKSVGFVDTYSGFSQFSRVFYAHALSFCKSSVNVVNWFS